MVPGASWPTIKKVIRAYAATSGDDPSGADVAKLGGLQRTVISACSKFLISAGILQPDKYKLTAIGHQLATAWTLGNAPMATEALQSIITSAPSLARLVDTVRARGSMEKKLIEGQIVVSAGLNSSSFLVPYVKTILDILEESKLIVINGDMIALGLRGAAGRANSETQVQGLEDREEDEEREQEEEEEEEEKEEPRKGNRRSRTPLPLGANRLGYLELPADWNAKELPKLVKMINLIFGDGQD